MDQEPDTNESELSGDEFLSREARHTRWQAKRPPIDHLEFGVATLTLDEDSKPLPQPQVVPLFDVGDRIVVDCRTNLLKGDPWLETIVGAVRTIDDDTGLVTLIDEESDPRSPTVRYVSFKNPLFDLRLAPTKGDPFEPPPKVKQPKPQREPGQKGRGRPKGSKNRPKDVIQAEKEARKAKKAKAA